MEPDANNWVVPEELLQNSPSRQDGITLEQEKEYRWKTSKFLESLGKTLDCPRATVATALLLFHRFFAVQSFKTHNRLIMAAAALFLSGKIMETRRRLKNIILGYWSLSKKSRPEGSKLEADEMERLSDKILNSERALLAALSYDLSVFLPYKSLMEKMKVIKPYLDPRYFAMAGNASIGVLNDSFRTSLCLQYDFSKWVVGCIYFSLISIRGLVPLKYQAPPAFTSEHGSGPAQLWYSLLRDTLNVSVSMEEVQDIVNQVYECYSQMQEIPAPNRLQQEAEQKERERRERREQGKKEEEEEQEEEKKRPSPSGGEEEKEETGESSTKRQRTET